MEAARQFVSRQDSGTELAQFFEGWGFLGIRGHRHRRHDLTPIRVGNPDNLHFRDAGVSTKRPRDARGENLFPAGVYSVRDAPHQVQETLGIDET